ncbi:MAG: hypothetical protein M1381_09570 [Deltaproteobacteria bacterium]|nr:hypothetical protein [Deltaproteobacteria bacterium]MCL5792639.1 hypothetical protein [Deltaproteobacteria bacterium]
MKPDGSGVKRLTDPSTDCVLSQYFDLHPTACGYTIVFSSNRSGRFQLYSMSINGSNNHGLTDNAYLNDQPAWITIPPIK